MNAGTQQYTIRNVPAHVTAVLKKRARLSGRSFNQVVVDTLMAATQAGDAGGRLDWLFGAHDLDEMFDDAITQQSDVDPALWR
jgi:plasmid stability protein